MPIDARVTCWDEDDPFSCGDEGEGVEGLRVRRSIPVSAPENAALDQSQDLLPYVRGEVQIYSSSLVVEGLTHVSRVCLAWPWAQILSSSISPP